MLKDCNLVWNIKIESAKLEWKVTSKVGSLENAQHVPGGGAKKVSLQIMSNCNKMF